jgi:MFS family permease
VISLLRRNGDFRALFLAQIVSFCGDWFATVAMLGLVIDRTDSNLATAAVFVVQMLPAFLLSPFAGPAADRFDRRKLMLGVSVLQAASAGLFLAALHGPIVFAFVGQGLISALGAFFLPASQAAMPNLVDADDLKLAVGAAVGGAFTVAFGRDAAFVADGASFLVAAALIISIRRPTQEVATERARGRMRALADTVETVRYARTNPLVAALLSSKLGFGLGSGTMAMLPLLASGPFDSGDTGTGILLGARGLGVVVGPFIANWLLARRIGRSPMSGILLVCGTAGLVYAAGYLVVGVAPVLLIAALGALLAHLGGGAQWALSTYGLQSAVPDYIRGRVFAADFALVTVSMSLSLLVSGALAELTGPRLPTLLLAGVGALWSAVYLTLTRPLRRQYAEAGEAVSSAASRR